MARDSTKARLSNGVSGHSRSSSDDEEQDSRDSFYDLEEQLIKNIKETDSSGVSRTRTIISGYDINMTKLLGKGSYGKVCLAKNLTNSKTYACKIMDISQAPVNFVERFLPRELQILSQLRHPNIIRVYTYVKHHQMYYIFMDYCANGDLLRYLQRKGQEGDKLTEDEARDKFVQILMGIKYLHQRHIAHRDLKCENILIDGVTLKLADFGFARSCIDPTTLQLKSSSHVARIQIDEFRSRKVSVLHTSDPSDEDYAFREMRRSSQGRHSAAAQLARMPPDRPSDGSLRSKSRANSLTPNKRQRRTSQSTTKSTSFCGSVAYASPEVVAGEQYDPTVSDMWSCGVILYILMMGKMPFDDSHPRKMLRRQRAKRYLEKVRGVLSEHCIDLMESLMEPSPSKRVTVDDALLHTWLRPTYRQILHKLITSEKQTYHQHRQPRPKQKEEMKTGPLNNTAVKPSDKPRSAQSAMSTKSRSSTPDDSTRSAHSTVSNQSGTSDMSTTSDTNVVTSRDSQLVDDRRFLANKPVFLSNGKL